MSSNQSDKDDDVLSGVEQPIDENQIGSPDEKEKSPFKDLDEIPM